MLTAPRPSSAPALDLPAAAGASVHEVLARLSSSEAGLSGGRRRTTEDLRAERAVLAPGHRVRHPAPQLRNPLLILLLAAAAVSALTGDPTDAVIIAVDRGR